MYFKWGNGEVFREISSNFQPAQAAELPRAAQEQFHGDIWALSRTQGAQTHETGAASWNLPPLEQVEAHGGVPRMPCCWSSKDWTPEGPRGWDAQIPPSCCWQTGVLGIAARWCEHVCGGLWVLGSKAGGQHILRNRSQNMGPYVSGNVRMKIISEMENYFSIPSHSHNAAFSLF